MGIGHVTIENLQRNTSSMCSAWAQAQNQNPPQDPLPPPAADSDPVLLHRRPTPATASGLPPDTPPSSETVSLTVPKGMAIQVVLDKEVRIANVGQAIHGRTVEPVYAFDRLVVPVGAEVTGKITQLESVSGGKRTLEALNADLTPARNVGLEFDQLVLPNGQHIAMQTVVTPGSGEVIAFVTAAGGEQKKSVKDVASEKAEQAKEQAKHEWDNAVAQVEAPGKIHRAKRYLIAQLPVHPQYIDAGTVYFAELQAPLEFGSEPLTLEMARALGSPPPDGSSVRARLSASVSSATARKGDDVEAMLSRPLFDGEHLIFPQGSRLKGSVVEVQSARHLKHIALEVSCSIVLSGLRNRPCPMESSRKLPPSLEAMRRCVAKGRISNWTPKAEPKRKRLKRVISRPPSLSGSPLLLRETIPSMAAKAAPEASASSDSLSASSAVRNRSAWPWAPSAPAVPFTSTSSRAVATWSFQKTPPWKSESARGPSRQRS